MSKTSRRERREHQKERAVAEGDVAALEKLVEQSPRAAVAGLVRALGAPPADAAARAAELDALALAVCRKLRREGEVAPALAVAAAGGRRTAAMRMEEALASFGSGDDTRAAQVAAGDAEVAAVIGPLLQAVRGEEVAPSSPRTAAPLRALHAVARAVACTARGEIDEAREAVKRIPLLQRPDVLAREIALAATLGQPGEVSEALGLLLPLPSMQADARLRHLAAAEAALPLEDLERLPAALASDPDIARRVVPARLAAATSAGTRAEIICQAGVDAFDAPERAAAALYVGFVQIRSDPEEAARTFDRVIQLGGDLVEAFRGKLLAALALAHGGGAAQRRANREVAAAADRLAHTLERRPHGGPLASVAGRLAAQRWVAVGDGRAALASIARARPHAGGKLVEALDLVEVEALAIRHPEQAERRLDALLAQAPGNVEAWKRKADLAAMQGDPERADRILLDAAEVTRDPALAADAREIRGELGQIAPFEGLVPGVATAGALAKELARTTTEDDDPLPLAAACREKLGPAARLAFDAAAVVIAACDGTAEMAEARLRVALLAHRGAPGDVARIVGAALDVGFEEGVVAAARALGDDAPALIAIAETLAVAGHGKLVGKLLPRFSAGLTRERVGFFKALSRGDQPAEIAGVPDPEQAVRELDLALAPELSLVEYLNQVDEDDDEDDDEGGDYDPMELGLPGQGGILGDLLETLGIPPEAADTIPKKKLLEIELRLVGLMVRRPGPEMVEEIVEILNESGIAPRFKSLPRRRR